MQISKELIGVAAFISILAYTLFLMWLANRNQKKSKPRKLKDITFSDAIEELSKERKLNPPVGGSSVKPPPAKEIKIIGCQFRSNSTCRFCEDKDKCK